MRPAGAWAAMRMAMGPEKDARFDSRSQLPNELAEQFSSAVKSGQQDESG